jgi:hypothetical protein
MAALRQIAQEHDLKIIKTPRRPTARDMPWTVGSRDGGILVSIN